MTRSIPWLAALFFCSMFFCSMFFCSMLAPALAAPAPGATPNPPKIPPKAAPVEAAPVEAAPDFGWIRATGPTTYAVQAAGFEAMLLEPAMLMRSARLLPYHEAGVPAGFKLAGVRPGALADRIGLKNGDIVRAVNGHRLDSMDATMAAYAVVRDAETIDLDVIRAGAPLTLRYVVERAPAPKPTAP